MKFEFFGIVPSISRGLFLHIAGQSLGTASYELMTNGQITLIHEQDRGIVKAYEV